MFVTLSLTFFWALLAIASFNIVKDGDGEGIAMILVFFVPSMLFLTMLSTVGAVLLVWLALVLTVLMID